MHQSERDSQVTYIIGRACLDVRDQSCVSVCPVDCIHDFGRMMVIDPESCIDCGACEVECPVEAIRCADELPAGWEPFAEITSAFTGNREAIPALIAEQAERAAA
jgi:NAD-dependent dihydropyrimidine dehydrogenase PreA subunit